VTFWRFPVVVVGSRGVWVDLGGVVMFCVVRVPLLMRGYSGVLVNRTGIGCAGFAVIRAIANAHYAADSNAQEPQQRERPRENAEQGTDSRFSRNSHLQSLANVALGRWHPADSVFVKNDFPAIRPDDNPDYAPGRAATPWGVTPIRWRMEIRLPML
jgi:hypothetical protein